MEESRHKCICLTWELIKDERVTNKMPDKSQPPRVKPPFPFIRSSD
jgi:hypothetical protein